MRWESISLITGFKTGRRRRRRTGRGEKKEKEKNQ